MLYPVDVLNFKGDIGYFDLIEGDKIIRVIRISGYLEGKLMSHIFMQDFELSNFLDILLKKHKINEAS